MLALARADSGGRETPASSSLTDAARQALADTLDLAQARGIDAGLEQAEELTVLAPPQGLRMLARNLVDNAVRYSPRGARVDVRVREQDGKVLLEVDDSGPGIPEADRPRVFDRFYRRADAPPGGSGLGLAIVRSVAERSHASVELLDSPLGGLRVRVSFPRPS